ncbi:MAG: BON domain-containing protein [Dehalococcoidales bacterium]|jgi:osmotically-inducible protein OsmY|nr:BON domain-containing protein [Dehalococcoidales bacterium]
MFGDDELKMMVLSEIRKEQKISNPAAIEVEVKDGIVTLKGFTDNYMEQAAAEAVAKQVPGVKGVVQNIQVRIPPHIKRDDAEIARDAINALALNSSIPRDRVKVVVKDEWITLEGDVDWPYQKEEALATVSRISGARGVTNNIQVKMPIRPIDVKTRIIKAFQIAAEHHARHLEVEIKDGKVILTGTVRAWFEKIEAERVAREMPGVKEVENRLVISPLVEDKEPIEIKQG